MSEFSIHWNILPAAQRGLWPSLSATVASRFVLYGGTAVALRLGHRTSIDFDFFTEMPLDRAGLDRAFPFLSKSKVLQDSTNTLGMLSPSPSGTVKISFFGGISIGRVGTPDQTPDGVLQIASLLDLLATKLKDIQQRIESKDYLDIIAILKSGTPLDEGLAAASVLYGPAFQPSEAVKALTCFEGGDLSTLESDDKKYLVHAVSRVRHIPPLGVLSRSLSL